MLKSSIILILWNPTLHVNYTGIFIILRFKILEDKMLQYKFNWCSLINYKCTFQWYFRVPSPWSHGCHCHTVHILTMLNVLTRAARSGVGLRESLSINYPSYLPRLHCWILLLVIFLNKILMFYMFINLPKSWKWL